MNPLQNKICLLLIFVHGNNGISCPNDELVSGFFLDLEYFKHSWQLSTICFSWSFTPGQYTDCMAHSLHFWSPKWLSWIWLRIVSHCLLGTTILVPFRIRPSSVVSSSQNVQYGCRTCSISLMVLGHPDIMVCLRRASSSSA